MPKVRVQLTIDVEGFSPASGSFEEFVTHSADRMGMEYFIEEGLLSLRSDILYGQFYDDLPAGEDLFPQRGTRRCNLDDIFTGKDDDEHDK